MMPSLPPGVVPYRRTPTFTARSVPQDLLREHSTKAGVWGRIVVLAGSVRYQPIECDESFVLGPGEVGIVAPTAPHRVEPSGDATFYVEFLR